MKNPEIKTRRISLVPMGIQFLESTRQYAEDEENCRFMKCLPNSSMEETKNFLLYCQKEWEKEKPRDMEFAILLGEVHVGGINLETDHEKPIAEIGWTVNKRYWRRGIATEAALALLAYARDELKLKKIIARCDAENLPSFKTMEKIGMKKISECGGRKNRILPEERREFLYELNFPSPAQDMNQ